MMIKFIKEVEGTIIDDCLKILKIPIIVFYLVLIIKSILYICKM